MKLTPTLRQVLVRFADHRDAVPLSITMLARELNRSRPTIHELLRRLCDLGYLYQAEPYGPYRATQAGKDASIAAPSARADGKARPLSRCPRCRCRLY